MPPPARLLGLPQALEGHCGATRDGVISNCSTDTQGAFGLQSKHSHSWMVAASACLASCAACERCRWVSLSLRYMDCSWYSSCATVHPNGAFVSLPVSSAAAEPLRNRVAASVAKRREHVGSCQRLVKPARESLPSTAVTPAASSSSSHLRVGLATLYAPDPAAACGRGVGCGLLPWCAGARRLRQALRNGGFDGRIDLLAVYALRGTESGATRQSSCATERFDERDCAGLRIVQPSQRLRSAARLHVRRVISGGIMSYNSSRFMRRMSVVFWKWELLRLGDEYDAILFLDLDVDALPSTSEGGRAAAVAHEWAAELPNLVASARAKPGGGFVIVGYSEVTTPLNAGVFWLLPPAGRAGLALYDEGVRVLSPSITPWNATHGFNRSGTPARLFVNRPLRHADGTLVLDRRGGREPIMLRLSGWDAIDGGDLEQGLLLYMLYVRRDAGVFVRRRGTHHVRHYVRGRVGLGGGKPWARVLTWREDVGPRCSWDQLKRRAYLRAALSDDDDARGGASACALAFARARRALDGLDAGACCEQMGWSAPIGHYGGDLVPVF